MTHIIFIMNSREIAENKCSYTMKTNKKKEKSIHKQQEKCKQIPYEM